MNSVFNDHIMIEALPLAASFDLLLHLDIAGHQSVSAVKLIWCKILITIFRDKIAVIKIKAICRNSIDLTI